ncbi:hypothetical protein CDL12_22211 [Handroanthus impetiginosus]|uniref:Uncharacterized protein n=1 Tax=Handroanthus impetiginosus TaxID=429701 RepID=A0A2G9GJ80_9LAMI|nr:hypothetical protein CDL12_22211 [Handroanthus impetiginosus]
MPKDRRVNTSFDRSMVSPYSCSPKVSDRCNRDSSLPHVGNETDWEEARCPICMEHPHNAVLLLCSSREIGCRPFICDTSYRHSNCFDQFRKSSASSSLETHEGQRAELVCPFCRGLVTGWDVMQPARKFMNSKSRSCSLETCSFIGNYAELRKHARLEHPLERPSEVSPARQSDWTMMEQQREIEDALAYTSDAEYDWDGWPSWADFGEDDGLLSDGDFFDFPSGMSDIEDEMIDELFGGLSLSFFSLYSSFDPPEELMDSGSSRSSDSLQRTAVSTSSGSRSFPNSRSRSIYHGENGATVSRSRSGYHMENDRMTNSRSRTSYNWENGSTVSNLRSNYPRETAPTNFRTRLSYRRENGSTISRSRSSYHGENAPASSRARSTYHGEYAQPSARARPRLFHGEVAPQSTGRLPGTSRQPHSNFGRRED